MIGVAPALGLALVLLQAQPQLVLTGVGRWAMFADAASITADGDSAVRMRSLQVADADFTIGDKAYWGGWSWWRFDCAEQTGQRLDFASLAADGTEGPITPVNGAPEPLAPGGDAAELAAVACAAKPPIADAGSVADAVRLGRAQLND